MNAAAATTPRAGPTAFPVLLEQSEEGYAVSAPGLPGCHSQGATEDEALANIADAIREYLAVGDRLTPGQVWRQVLVEVGPCPGSRE